MTLLDKISIRSCTSLPPSDDSGADAYVGGRRLSLIEGDMPATESITLTNPRKKDRHHKRPLILPRSQKV
jgi:hypothetical protein